MQCIIKLNQLFVIFLAHDFNKKLRLITKTAQKALFRFEHVALKEGGGGGMYEAGSNSGNKVGGQDNFE